MLRILLVAVLLPALPAHAGETTIATPVVSPAKPAATATPGTATHHWYDGQRRRDLVVDERLRVDFDGDEPVLAERATPSGKAFDAATGGEAPAGSPVFRDADSPAVKRALPGGAILTTRNPVDAESLGRMLAAYGVSVSRALDESGTRWLVETPPGIAGLELANRLHESGDFATVSPNWWRERALK